MGLSSIIHRLIPVWLHECSYPEQTEHWQPEPDAEVGGPLLTTVLVATAWLTLVATAFYRLLALDSNQIASPRNSDDEPATNCVDQATSRLASRISSRRFVAGRFRGKGQPGWRNTVAKSILTLCDVQTLIGLTLLVSGFLSLSHRISTYHFILVVQTVWFAHVAQLNALSIFRFAYPTNNFVGKWGRILLALALSALLIWAIIPTWFFNWAFLPGFKFRPQPDKVVGINLPGGSASWPASNTVCYFEVFRSIRWHYESSRLAWKWQDTPAFGSGVAAIVLIVVNTLIRIFRVNGWLTSVVISARRGISKGWRGVFTDASQGDAPSQKLAAHIGLATLLTTRFHSDLLASTLSGIYWLIIPAIWGTISLNRTRSIVEVKDNNWTFGQMVSIVVVLGILLVAIGNIFTFPGIKTSSSLPTVEPAQHYTDDDETEHATPSTSRPRPDSIPSNQDAPPLLSSDYSTAPWINPAIILLLINSVLFTLLFFCNLSQWQPNVLSLVVRYLVPVLVGIPSATFVFILLGLAYEKGLSAGSTETAPYWWIMGVVWALTGGLYSVFVWTRALGALEVVQFVIIGVGAAIGLANVLAVVAARAARRGAISL